MSSNVSRTADRETELAALLDLDFDGFADDLEFYEHMARASDGKVLELGVGSGRVAVHLARRELEVWGVEACASLIAIGERKAGDELPARLHIQCGDMRAFDLGRRFEFGYAAFGTFHHLLTPEDQVACLRCVREHLNPGGLFAFDLRPLHRVEWEAGDSAALLHDWTRTLPGTGETVTKLRAVRPNPVLEVQHELHIYDIAGGGGALRRVTSEVDLRFSTRYEVEGLLREAGLELDRMYGDYDLSPYDEESEYMITVARRPAKETA